MKAEIGIVNKLGGPNNVWPLARDRLGYISRQSMGKWFIRGLSSQAELMLRKVADERGIEYEDEDFKIVDTNS